MAVVKHFMANKKVPLKQLSPTSPYFELLSSTFEFVAETQMKGRQGLLLENLYSVLSVCTHRITIIALGAFIKLKMKHPKLYMVP